jgi:hypothetical protein
MKEMRGIVLLVEVDKKMISLLLTSVDSQHYVCVKSHLMRFSLLLLLKELFLGSSTWT